jgi:prophage antirepressor-like protein
MAKDILLFKFETKEIRCINIGDDAWFALTDVLAGMKSSTKVSDAKASVIEAFGDEGVKDLPMLDAVGRQQETACIPSDAVIFLVSASRTDEGRRLRRWIFTEVLPSIRKTGSYSISESIPRQLPPVRDAIEYLNAAKEIQVFPDPLLRSLLNQRLMEDLSAGQPLLTASAQPQVILTVRAKELGYTDKQIGNGARLGRFVSKVMPPNGKTYHGRYNVNVYDLTPELDETIHAYFR